MTSSPASPKRATIEVGDDAFAVTVSEVTGDERDRIYDEQARRYPGRGVRQSRRRGSDHPVLALRRTD
jgi:hypothetical protein